MGEMGEFDKYKVGFLAWRRLSVRAGGGEPANDRRVDARLGYRDRGAE